MARDNFPLKKGIFGPMGQKDGKFLFWLTPEQMITFLGLKNHTFPQEAFFWNGLYKNKMFQKVSFPVSDVDVAPTCKVVSETELGENLNSEPPEDIFSSVIRK